MIPNSFPAKMVALKRRPPILTHLLKAKIHHATVTLTNPEYHGSITIDLSGQPLTRNNSEADKTNWWRNLAEDIMKALGKKHVRRHLEGDWIRSQIQKDSGKVYLPAVLRNTLIPIKLLIEVANMTNETDAERLADPQWRQEFAEAYVDALEAYFGS